VSPCCRLQSWLFPYEGSGARASRRCLAGTPGATVVPVLSVAGVRGPGAPSPPRPSASADTVANWGVLFPVLRCDFLRARHVHAIVGLPCLGYTFPRGAAFTLCVRSPFWTSAGVIPQHFEGVPRVAVSALISLPFLLLVCGCCAYFHAPRASVIFTPFPPSPLPWLASATSPRGYSAGPHFGDSCLGVTWGPSPTRLLNLRLVSCRSTWNVLHGRSFRPRTPAAYGVWWWRCAWRLVLPAPLRPRGCLSCRLLGVSLASVAHCARSPYGMAYLLLGGALGRSPDGDRLSPCLASFAGRRP